MFSLKFCETRSIDDLPVANQALIVWESVRKTVKFGESSAKSWHPQNKSYHVVLDHYKDPFVPARLHFLNFLASLLKKLLVLFRIDNTMIPLIKD